MRRLELRNVPAQFIRDYLLNEFEGVEQPDGSVAGGGWVVRFEAGGSVRFAPNTLVPVVFVEIDGRDTGPVTAFVMRKSIRGGG